jgi:ankyrin repeat protein
VVVKILLDKNADIESEDKSGGTLLSLAAEADHKAVVKLIIGHAESSLFFT